MLRPPHNGERRLVHDIQRLRSYGDEASLARAEGLERAINAVSNAFGKGDVDCRPGSTAWPERVG